MISASLSVALGLALAPRYAIIPQPSSLQPLEGVFTLDQRTVIVADAGAKPIAQVLKGYLKSTLLPLRIAPAKQGNAIVLALDGNASELGREGYRIHVATDRILCTAKELPGLFYSLQTLRQLLPEEVFRSQTSPTITEWVVPCSIIEDRPRFAWRGAHMDVARHFMPKEFILRFLDLMALHKLNTFHWHLTDDQGWRIEIKKYPNLTRIGSKRKQSMLAYDPPTYDENVHEGFYSQMDVAEIVNYAKARFINIVPEIEMPGHSQAAIASYPELGNLNERLQVCTHWGVIKNVFNVKDSTLGFLQNVLDELISLFPGKFIHIGGDECPKDQWKASKEVQERIKSLGLKDEHEMQSWFIKQMDAFLASRNRRLIGWDEILEGGLAPGATVMNWRGEEHAIAAANAGHDVVMAPTGYTYFDYYQSRDRKGEPHSIGGYLPLKTVYAFEPVPANLKRELSHHILGAQFQLWSEYIRTPEGMEFRAFPRACALAEVVWSNKPRTTYENFLNRLAIHLERLEALKVSYRPLDPPEAPPIAGWLPGQISESWTELDWKLPAAEYQGANYEITFQYVAGAHRLDIQKVQLIVAGQQVAIDAHDGVTGGENRRNVYVLKFPHIASTQNAVIRAMVRCDGGSDSRGEVTIRRIDP